MLRLRCPSRHFATAAASAMKTRPTVEPVQQKISRLPTGFSVSSVELKIAKRTAEMQTLTTANCSSSFAADQACQLLAKGTALLSPHFQIGNITNKRTPQIVNSRWLTKKAALIGVNIEHDLLLDYAGPISQLMFAFRSGARFQQHDEAGLTHQLRNAIGTDSTNYLGVRLLWVTGQSGATLQANLSRSDSFRHYSTVGVVDWKDLLTLEKRVCSDFDGKFSGMTTKFHELSEKVSSTSTKHSHVFTGLVGTFVLAAATLTISAVLYVEYKLESVRADVKAQLESVRADVKAQLESVRADVKSIEHALAFVRADLKEDLASVRADVKSIERGLNKLLTKNKISMDN